MAGDYLFFAELMLTLGAVVGLGLWELARTNRAIRKRKAEENKEKESAKSRS